MLPMYDSMQHDELIQEANRLLRYRVPLFLAVLINVILVIRIPLRATQSTSPTPGTGDSVAMATANDERVTTVKPATPPADQAESAPTIEPADNSPQVATADNTATPRISVSERPHWQAGLRDALTRWTTGAQAQLSEWHARSSANDHAPRLDNPQLQRIASHPMPAPPTSPETASVAHSSNDSAQREPARLVIRNPGRNDGPVRFLVNQQTYILLPGEAHEFTTARQWNVLFHRGGDLGNKDLTVTAGIYQFEISDSGWRLVRVDRPTESADSQP